MTVNRWVQDLSTLGGGGGFRREDLDFSAHGASAGQSVANCLAEPIRHILARR